MATAAASSAEIARNFGLWQARAVQGPVTVLHHGRPRTVLLSAGEYRQLVAGSAEAAPSSPAALDQAVLMERIDDGFLALDAALGVRACNAAAALILRRTPADLIGASLFAALPDARDGPVEVLLYRTLRTGEGADTVLAAAGEQLHLRIFAWTTGVAVMLRRRGTEDRLDRARLDGAALGRALAAHGGVGSARLSLQGILTRVDEGLEALTGFAAVRLVGTRLVDVLTAATRAGAMDAIDRAAAGGEPGGFDAALLARDGMPRGVRIGIAAWRDGRGAADLVAAVTRTGSHDGGSPG